MGDKKALKNTVVLERLKKLIDTTTREEIGKGIGCDTSMITKHYNGNREITVDFLVKYANYFHVSADYLLGLTDSQTPIKTDKGQLIRSICDYTGLSEEAVSNLHEYNGNSGIGFKGLDFEPRQDVYLEFINYLLEYDTMDTDIFLKVSECKRKIKYYFRVIEIIKSHIDTLSQSFINDDLHYTYKEFSDQCYQEIIRLEDIQRNSRIDYIECVDAFEKILSEFVKPEKEELSTKAKQYKIELHDIHDRFLYQEDTNADNNKA